MERRCPDGPAVPAGTCRAHPVTREQGAGMEPRTCAQCLDSLASALALPGAEGHSQELSSALRPPLHASR